MCPLRAGRACRRRQARGSVGAGDKNVRFGRKGGRQTFAREDSEKSREKESRSDNSRAGRSCFQAAARGVYTGGRKVYPAISLWTPEVYLTARRVDVASRNSAFLYAGRTVDGSENSAAACLPHARTGRGMTTPKALGPSERYTEGRAQFEVRGDSGGMRRWRDLGQFPRDFGGNTRIAWAAGQASGLAAPFGNRPDLLMVRSHQVTFDSPRSGRLSRAASAWRHNNPRIHIFLLTKEAPDRRFSPNTLFPGDFSAPAGIGGLGCVYRGVVPNKVVAMI